MGKGKIESTNFYVMKMSRSQTVMEVSNIDRVGKNTSPMIFPYTGLKKSELALSNLELQYVGSSSIHYVPQQLRRE